MEDSQWRGERNCLLAPDNNTNNGANVQLQSRLNSENNLEQHKNKSTRPSDHAVSGIEKGNAYDGGGSCVPDTTPWEIMFQALVEFKLKHGHTKVTKNHNETLYKWTHHQQHCRSRLSSHQQRRLESIGFQWRKEERDEDWMERYGELVEHKKKYGRISRVHISDSLYSWVQQQRRSCAEKWRFDLLDDIGFVWHSRHYTWMRKYEELVEHKKKYGDISQLNVHLMPKSLYFWVQHQRKICKEQWRIDLLNDIGFVWRSRNESWMKKYEELVEHKKTHGDCAVPLTSKPLHAWVRKQRKSCKEQWRIDLLNKIGFSWSSNNHCEDKRASEKQRWMNKYQELVEYKRTHGTTSVPLNWKENPQLSSWVQQQQRTCKEQWRIDLLNDIDFDWSIWSVLETQRWMNKYKELVEYKKTYGTACVPLNWKENPQLSSWVELQRRTCNEQWRIDLLNDIDFDWSVWSINQNG